MNQESLAKQVLHETFGYQQFRPSQETIIETVLEGRDCLVVMPTGGGKSLCYQVPALLKPGVALVVSPLISLMKDQIAALKAAGVPAAYLNSSLTPGQQREALRRAALGTYRVVYVAPERLEMPEFEEGTTSVGKTIGSGKIGKDLGIFMFSDLVGKGLPMWLPNGFILRRTLADYIMDLYAKSTSTLPLI